MSFKMEEKYTPAMADRDVLVFLKTNFCHIGDDAKGRRRKIMDKDNYVYAMFPNRQMRSRGIPSCESYVKPEGNILSWKNKLPKTETCELDALSEDVPATWDEYSDLLTKLVVDNTVREGVIVIEDASTWQKLGEARRKLYRRQLGDIIEEGVRKDKPDCERRGEVYPLAIAM